MKLNKYFCFYLSVILFVCYETDVAELLTYAYELGMYNGEYAFVTIDFFLDKKWEDHSWYKTNEIVSGILNVGVKTKSSKEELGSQLIDYEQRVNDVLLKKYGFHVRRQNLTVSIFVPYIYFIVQ